MVDYEADVAIVIGETCCYVSAKDARSVIADYMIVNDVSARGVARTPPSFVKPGDVMRVEIEQLGHIENRVVAEA